MKNNLSPAIKRDLPPFPPFSGGGIHPLFDQSVYFGPQSGTDDGTLVKTPSKGRFYANIKALENWHRERESYKDLVYKIKVSNIDEQLKTAYLERLTQTRISILDEAPEFDLKSEISASKICSTAYNSLFAPLSGDLYHTLLHCMKFWCPFCGGRNKKIHNRRKKLMLRKLNRGRVPKNRAEFRAVANEWLLRQFVLTVPEDDRFRFASREDINKLSGVARRTIKEFYPGQRVVAYIHTVGDDNPRKFNPHINVQIFYRKRDGVRLKETPEKLNAIKDRWARGLRRLGCSDVRGPGEDIAGKRVDVQYSFATKPRKVLFKIRYMTRPLGPEEFGAWHWDDNGKELMDLHVRQLKGFQFIRNWDRWAGCNYYDTEDAVKETESIAGEPLRFIGYTSPFTIKALFDAGKLAKIGKDLYRQRAEPVRNRGP